jgi:hypothetical protein
MAVNRFTAAFDGECNECLTTIFEGDEAGYIDDEVCCGPCCDRADMETGRKGRK